MSVAPGMSVGVAVPDWLRAERVPIRKVRVVRGVPETERLTAEPLFT